MITQQEMERDLSSLMAEAKVDLMLQLAVAIHAILQRRRKASAATKHLFKVNGSAIEHIRRWQRGEIIDGDELICPAYNPDGTSLVDQISLDPDNKEPEAVSYLLSGAIVSAGYIQFERNGVTSLPPIYDGEIRDEDLAERLEWYYAMLGYNLKRTFEEVWASQVRGYRDTS